MCKVCVSYHRVRGSLIMLLNRVAVSQSVVRCLVIHISSLLYYTYTKLIKLKPPRLWQCSGSSSSSPGCPETRRSIGSCVHAVPASLPMETIFIGVCCFAQNISTPHTKWKALYCLYLWVWANPFSDYAALCAEDGTIVMLPKGRLHLCDKALYQNGAEILPCKITGVSSWFKLINDSRVVLLWILLVFVCIYRFILEQCMDVKFSLFHTQIQNELSHLVYAFLPYFSGGNRHYFSNKINPARTLY
jgi:hypothetical protein